MNIKELMLGMATLGALASGASLNTGTAPWECFSSNPTPCTGNVPVNLGAGSGPWVAAQDGAQWIGPTATSTPTSSAAEWALPGTYVYELRFAALGGSFQQYSNLKIAADNSAIVQFCDDSNGCTTIHNQAGPLGFQAVSTIPSGFVPLSATRLRVTVTNDFLQGVAEGRNPTGFFLSGDFQTPEPSALSLLGIGVAALVAARARFRRC